MTRWVAMRLRTAVPGVLVAVAVFGAAPAAAVTTRFVVPTGGVMSAPCDQPHPCTAAYVMSGAGSASGDIVDVAPGTYDLDAAPIALARTLDIRGEAGSARTVANTSTGTLHVNRDTMVEPAVTNAGTVDVLGSTTATFLNHDYTQTAGSTGGL